MPYDKLAGKLAEKRVIAKANPYSVVGGGGKFKVVKTSTGEVKGTFSSRSQAMKQFRLLEAVEHGWHPTRK